MTVVYSILNRYGCSDGFNLLVKRNTSRLFSSLNLAFSALTSSEDETSVSDSWNALPTHPDCVHAERIKRGIHGNYAEIRCRFSGPFAHKYVETEIDKDLVMKSILEEQGWSFEYLNCGKVNWDEESIIRALDCLFEKSGSAELSFHFFRWSRYSLGLKHTVRSACVLIHILFLGNMKYKVVDLLTCLIHGRPQHAQPKELMEILQEICSREVLDTVYSMLVNCYIKAKMISEALEAICLMEEVSIFPSARVCNSLIKSLLDTNQEELAWDLLEKMQDRSLVCGITFSLFIYYYCSQGNLQCAWKLLMHINSYGIEPDVVAYTTFIHILCKLSYLKEATCLVFKMIHLGIYPDSVLFSSIIDGYCKQGRPGDAICILKLFDICPDVFVYNSFLTKLCKDGDMQKASSVFREMLESGIRPDCFIYTTMISGYSRASNRRKALQYLGRMLKDGIKPSVTTYTVIIDIYCRKGDMEIAQHLFQRMTRKGLIPDTVVCNTLINGYKNKGQIEKGLELLSMMTSAGISPDIVTYNTLIQGLIASGFVSEANDILMELIQTRFSPDVVTFTHVIGGYSDRMQFEKAFTVWSLMSHTNVRPDIITCNALLNGYCRTHRMDEARALFDKMLGFGLTPDLILYNTLIYGYCRSGDVEEACHWIKMMVENNILPNDITHKALVLGYERKGATNPMASADYKLEQIRQRHGFYVEQSET